MMESYKRYTFDAFTTPCELLIFASSPEEAEESFNAVYANAKRLEECYNFYSDRSELSRVNARNGAEHLMSDELAGLMKLALFYYQMTERTFDVAAAGSAKHVGWQEDALTPNGFVGLSEQIEIAGNRLIVSDDRIKIDLGGLVKEYAVDISAQMLRSSGIRSALINFGGDVYAFGSYYGKPWKVGIEHPDNPCCLIETVELTDSALCTSGHSKRKIRVGSQERSHIIPPDAASVSEYRQISTVAPTALDAGVWSTVLLINSSLNLPSHVSLAHAVLA